MKLATRRQLDYITKLAGERPSQLLSSRQASALIEQLKAKKRTRLCARGREAKYIQKAFESEISKLESTSKGGRNNQLFVSAVRLFELANASSELTHSEIENALEKACQSNGLDNKEVERTIKSASKHAGIAKLPDFGQSFRQKNNPRWQPTRGREAPISTNAPPLLWSEKALSFCRACRKTLWEPKGQKALDYLRGRGLSDDIIRNAWLGYNPYSRTASRESWGLEPDGNRQMFAWGHSIVIPWFVGPSIWCVRFRQMGNVEKEQRYRQLAGCGNALYMSDTLKPGRLAVMTEGEIDTLSIRQHAPSDVATVATGGVSNARRGMWIAKLVLCKQVLLAFDDDVAGYNATEWWTNVLPNAKRWLLPYGDANDYVRSGGDIAAWLAPAITSPQAPQPIKLVIEVDEDFDFDEGLYEATLIVEKLRTQKTGGLYLRYEDALIAQDIVAAISALKELRALKATADEWQKFEQTRQFDELLAQREGWR